MSGSTLVGRDPAVSESGNEMDGSSKEAASPPSNGTLESQEHLTSPNEERKYTLWQWLLVCLAIYSSSFLYGLDNAIVADIQGHLIEDLGEVGKLGWLAIGFPLGSVATILSL